MDHTVSELLDRLQEDLETDHRTITIVNINGPIYVFRNGCRHQKGDECCGKECKRGRS